MCVQPHRRQQIPGLHCLSNVLSSALMLSFHSKLLSLKSYHCRTCFEYFPDLTMAAAGSTDCRLCSQDKHIPKLYTTANNMIPGAVPPQFQVDILGKHFFPLPPPPPTPPPPPPTYPLFTLFEIVILSWQLGLSQVEELLVYYYANSGDLPTSYPWVSTDRGGLSLVKGLN